MMKRRMEDPRTGVMIVELQDFSRAEPDPKLCRVRPGYTVKTTLQSLKEFGREVGGCAELGRGKWRGGSWVGCCVVAGGTALEERV